MAEPDPPSDATHSGVSARRGDPKKLAVNHRNPRSAAPTLVKSSNDYPSDSWTVFAVPGWGSAIAEAILALCGVIPIIEDVTGFDRPGAARERLLRVNPLAQVPSVILPDGAVMTESAAIALLLAERYPQAGLAPPPGDDLRGPFLRRLVWIVANIYPTFTFGDYPERWVEANPVYFKESVERHRERLWQELEAAVDAGTQTRIRFCPVYCDAISPADAAELTHGRRTSPCRGTPSIAP
jgi:glutathione S-transferase